MKHKTITRLTVGLSVLLLGGCATVDGTDPHDMSAVDHQAAAQRAEVEAAEHEARYKPGAYTYSNCGMVDALNFCWPENPTAKHKRRAEQLRIEAQRHREASRALVDAEAKACHGISEQERDLSPFFHLGAIDGVKTEEDDRHIVFFKPIEGLSAAALQKMMDCHLARNAALGHTQASMPNCPLVPGGVEVNVEERGKRLAVEIQVNEERSLDEVTRRIEALWRLCRNQ